MGKNCGWYWFSRVNVRNYLYFLITEENIPELTNFYRLVDGAPTKLRAMKLYVGVTWDLYFASIFILIAKTLV